MTLPHLVQDRPPGQLRQWRHPPERFLVRWQPNRAAQRGGGGKKPSPVSPGLSFPVLAQEVHEHRWLQQAAISSSAPLKPAIDRGLICVERNVGYKGRAWWDGDGWDTGMTGKCFIHVTLQRSATRGHQNHQKSSKPVIAKRLCWMLLWWLVLFVLEEVGFIGLGRGVPGEQGSCGQARGGAWARVLLLQSGVWRKSGHPSFP